jgi:ankyrin repeat protein
LATKKGAQPYCAAKEGHLGLLQCLAKELGADVSQADIFGWTPFHIAAYQKHLDMIRCLVKYFGADVNQARQDDFTALHYAALEGQLAVVLYLVNELGADVNHVTHLLEPLPHFLTSTSLASSYLLLHHAAYGALTASNGHSAP